VLVVMVSLPSSAAPIPELPLILSQVGEAPVKLRGDQYDKLKRWKDSVCDIYVNHLGDVCLRKFERDPPNGGAVFAQTSWLDGYDEDDEGFPVFQGVRGVCAKINGSCSPVTSPVLTLTKALQTFKFFFVREGRDLSMAELRSKREALHQELSAMKKLHFQCRQPTDDLSGTHNNTINCQTCFKLKSHVDARDNLKSQIAKYDQLLRQAAAEAQE
jgi:hypothetical protein